MLTAVRTPPGALGLARVLFALGAMLTCFEGAVYLFLLQGDRIRVPTAGGLVSPDLLPAVPWFLVMLVACVLLLVGVVARPCTIVLALGNVLLLLADQQLYSNHRLLLVLLCLWLSLVETNRARSLRSRLRPPAERSDRLVAWWPQLLVVATVSSCYLFAGLSKLNPEFLTGDLIASMSPAWVPAQATAWLTPPTEIAIALGIWWRPTRRLALLLGVALHLSIVVLLGSPLVFGAFALLCLSAYPLVWTWPGPEDQPDAAAIQRSSAA